MNAHRQHYHRLSLGAKVGGILLVLFAAVIITIEVMLHVFAAVHDKTYHINYWMLLISAVTGFTGLYILSPPRAKDGGQFIVSSAIRIIQVIKAGRRKGDPMSAIVEDEEGRTATVMLPSPVESEVPIQPMTDALPNRRKTDPGNMGGTGEHPTGGPTK